MSGWSNEGKLNSRIYQCGHCGSRVASVTGWNSGSVARSIHICPNCNKPTYFEGPIRVPDATPGNEVASLPDDIDALYREARRCVSISAFTSSVLASRKLLAHIAVEKGAAPGGSFLDYVEHLSDAGYVPPGGRGWVDHIRKRGNEANHEIVLMRREDSEDLVTFLEMLLKFVYEFPAKVPTTPGNS